ncbi:MAG: aldose epimerase family protein [Candidatus Methanomethylophilaceae archaeon]
MEMEWVCRPYGRMPDGTEVHLYSMWNGRVQLDVTDYGAHMVRVCVPDIDGSVSDVILGYDRCEDYLANRTSYGAVMGRHAGRIAGGSFSMDGVRYELEKDGNGNNLHSGKERYGRRMWETVSANENGVVFRIESPDGDQGFPGNAVVTVTYSITEDNAVRIEYDAVSDRDTVFNMTNHSYFNLDGPYSDSVADHLLRIDSDMITKDREDGVSTDDTVDVAGTIFDFRTVRRIGDGFGDPSSKDGGYDNTYLLNGKGMRKVATLASDVSGICMDVLTDMPAMVLYTANGLNETGRCGRVNGSRSAVCLETQYVPGAIETDRYDRCVFRGGERFRSVTEYKFHEEHSERWEEII